MRTALDIPDALYRKIKTRTAQEGSTVRSVTLLLYTQWLNGDTFFVSDLVVSETYYALQHHYGKTKEESTGALLRLSDDDAIAFSEGVESALALPDQAKANPGFMGRVLAADYRGRGQITVSCEKSFRRLPDTEVVM